MRNLRLYNTDAAFKAHEQSAGGDGNDTVTVVPGVSMSSDQRKRYFNPHDTSILVQEVKVNYCIGNYSLATGKTRVKYVSGISTDAYVKISPAPIKGKPYTISQPFADVVIPPSTSTTVSAKCAPNLYVKCTYNVTTTGSATRIFSTKPSYMWGIVVDGETFISGNSVSTGRTFSTTGEHEVVFCFSGTNISLTSYAFQYCTSLTSVEICSGFTAIESRCFYGCNSLTSITIPNGITELQSSCFNGCSALKKIEIPNSVTLIGVNTFSFCSSLDSLVIPSSVTTLSRECFSNCSSLRKVTFQDGIAVSTLPVYCFLECSSLTDITIPNSVTNLEARCFEGCSSLRDITIHSGITVMGTYCFSRCFSLTGLTIESGVTSLPNYCFCGCTSLTSVTIPSSVTNIGFYCFASCSSLLSIICDATVAPTIDSLAFYNVGYGGTLYYPSGSDYSTLLSTAGYYLGYYDWTGQEI